MGAGEKSLETSNFNHGDLNAYFIELICTIFTELPFFPSVRPLASGSARTIYTYAYLKISHNSHPQLN